MTEEINPASGSAPETLSFDPITGQPVSTHPPADRPQLIAPVWHTALIVLIILVNSYYSSTRLAQGPQRGRIPLYVGTLVLQSVMLGLIWIGLRLQKTSLRGLIGGQWTSLGEFLIDFCIFFAFWIVSSIVVLILKLALGLASLDPKRSSEQIHQAKQAIGGISPQTSSELLAFLVLVIFVGVIEEIIFRGYLQRQMAAITRNSYVGVVLSAVIFGAAHGYQGTRWMILLGIYGTMFGLLAHFWKSLRPGMMAHAWQDAFSGATFYFLTKLGRM